MFMKNLILTSKLSNVLSEILENTAVLQWKKKVWFIENAADFYKSKSFVLGDRKAFLENNFEVVDIDLRVTQNQTLEKILSEIDIIFVSGWNTFYLLEMIRASWFDNLLRDFLNKWKIYIGSSAGSIVLWNSIDHVKTLDNPNKSTLQDYTGLKILDAMLLPHYWSTKYLEKMNDILATYWREKFMMISDESFVIESV